jgi:hypothetical protein
MADKMTFKALLSAASSIWIIGPIIKFFLSLEDQKERKKEQVRISTLESNNPRVTIDLMHSRLSEIVGEEAHDKMRIGSQVQFILHPESYSELKPFIQKRWLIISSNGSSVGMGSGNKNGSALEDIKRPHGMGTDYTISLNLDRIP